MFLKSHTLRKYHDFFDLSFSTPSFFSVVVPLFRSLLPLHSSFDLSFLFPPFFFKTIFTTLKYTSSLFFQTNKRKPSSESLHKSHISSNKGHDQADKEIQRGNGIMHPLVLRLADLRPLNVKKRRNDGHERRAADGSSDSHHGGQVVKEDSHGHAGEHHHHGDQGELPVLCISSHPSLSYWCSAA